MIANTVDLTLQAGQHHHLSDLWSNLDSMIACRKSIRAPHAVGASLRIWILSRTLIVVRSRSVLGVSGPSRLLAFQHVPLRMPIPRCVEASLLAYLNWHLSSHRVDHSTRGLERRRSAPIFGVKGVCMLRPNIYREFTMSFATPSGLLINPRSSIALH